MTPPRLLFCFASIVLPHYLGTADDVDFRRDVQPILHRHCDRCHGAAEQEAGLNLSLGALRASDDSGLIVAGDTDASMLITRVTDAEAGDLMPLDGERLDSNEVEILKRWIDDGAKLPFETESKTHWAYVRPTFDSARSIDDYVENRLAEEGLSRSPTASAPTLARRLSLAITGLPPSSEQVDALESGDSPLAYESLVDELLASPAFGQHWARHWLDLASYADSNGYQADQLRDSWAYRDWVVDAWNADMPFDQFVIKQVAGDLLPADPDPAKTMANRVATGFYRTAVCNVEAGVQPEANRVQQVFARVDTTATVFLGSTMECAQCHDHKYDPFSQADYYRMFAFFNRTPIEVEQKAGVRFDFVGPTMDLPDDPTTDTSQPATTLVMVESEPDRETFVMRRGDYLSPGAEVDPGTPSFLHEFDEELPKNRLGLARWLVDAENPLLARVTVNRIWAELFGRPIVATPEDFGSQCEPPSHPEMLDQLSLDWINGGWSLKRLIKQIVMSSTFRQSSNVSADSFERDPDNRWLSRGPRFRLPAETIRDNGLAIAGLLSPAGGGPPIMPYQPSGLWRAIGRGQPKWVAETNDDRFRRGLYVVWKRSSPYPSFTTFDAPDRSSCSVQRARTNTPLQALVLLNDVAYAEMAIGLAQRMVGETDSSDPRMIAAHGYRMATGHDASIRTLETLVRLHEDEARRIQRDPALARQRIKILSADFRDPAIDAAQTAAWYPIASVLLNLDATITQN